MIHGSDRGSRPEGQRGQIRTVSGDYYETLGVPRGASQATIKFAYRQLARKHHPDVSEGQAAAEQKLREINEAYIVLSDRRKRANYDRFGHAAAAVGGAENIARIFDMFFGATRGAAGPTSGKDLRCGVEVTAEELANGTAREISFRHIAACEACQGSGAEPGTPVSVCDRCSGGGTMRQVRQTPRSVSLTQTTCSLCDGEGQIVPSPCHVCQGRGGIESEKSVAVTIPPGSADGAEIRVDGGGEAGLRGGRDGDLYVRVIVAPERPARHALQSQDDVAGTALDERVAPTPPGEPREAPSRSSLRWSWIVAIAVLATIPTAAILYATHRFTPISSAAAGPIVVCATPSIDRFAADLVQGYGARGVNASSPSFTTAAAGSACDVRFSFEPGKAEAAVARDAIVAVVNPLNSITRISEPQLRAVFGGAVRDWSDLGGSGGAIAPFLPADGSDEVRALESSVFAGLAIDRGVMRRSSSADVTRAVAGADRLSRAAIGLVTFSQAVTSKMIPLAYLPPPNVLTIASRRYPLTLTITLKSEPGRDPAAAQQLIAFAHSRDGLAIVENDGLVPPEGF
jgi:hypothetical protein